MRARTTTTSRPRSKIRDTTRAADSSLDPTKPERPRFGCKRRCWRGHRAALTRRGRGTVRPSRRACGRCAGSVYCVLSSRDCRQVHDDGKGPARQPGEVTKRPDAETFLMAAFLYRVGRVAFRRRWFVALMWV